MRKTKEKITNTNTSEIKTTPARTIIEQYYDMHLFKHRPVTQNFLDNMAEEYVKWFVDNEDAIIFTQFLQAQRINRADFYRWLLRSEKLGKAHEFVLMVLCNRREYGALTRKYDATMVAKTHGHYSDIWVSESARIAALGNLEQKTGNITVVMQPFGESK